jgi:hypothetical protein
MANETRRFFEQDLERRLGAPPEPPPPAGEARIRYQIMTSVPENWIPLIPVHVAPNDPREVQLQRAAMPRILVGDPDPPVPVRPRIAASSGPRPARAITVLSPRRGSFARRRPRHAEFSAYALARRARVALARCP